MTSGKKLGRGLSSLLASRHAEEEAGDQSALWVAIDQLTPNRKQPRADVEKGVDRLAESIRRHGVMQPIVVTPLAPERYEIVAGERRWRAARKAGLAKVPVIVREAVTSDLERLELALIENVQREDLNSIERAKACRELVATYRLTQEDVAERLGFERSTVANLVRLLDLPESIQAAVSRETISAGHARALLRLQGHPRQPAAFEQMVREGWSVRQAEAICAQWAEAEGASPAHRARPRNPAWVRDLQERLTRGLGLRTEVRLLQRGGGRLVLHFQALEDLDRVVQRLDLPSEARELLEP